jgi:hypothetical protein
LYFLIFISHCYLLQHLTEEQIKEGLRSGKLHQGPLRQNLDNWLEANVPSDSLDEDILIKGRLNMNRAIDGFFSSSLFSVSLDCFFFFLHSH